MPFACKLTPTHTGQLSDITACDMRSALYPLGMRALQCPVPVGKRVGHPVTHKSSSHCRVGVGGLQTALVCQRCSSRLCQDQSDLGAAAAGPHGISRSTLHAPCAASVAQAACMLRSLGCNLKSPAPSRQGGCQLAPISHFRGLFIQVAGFDSEAVPICCQRPRQCGTARSSPGRRTPTALPAHRPRRCTDPGAPTPAHRPQRTNAAPSTRRCVDGDRRMGLYAQPLRWRSSSSGIL